MSRALPAGARLLGPTRWQMESRVGDILSGADQTAEIRLTEATPGQHPSRGREDGLLRDRLMVTKLWLAGLDVAALIMIVLGLNVWHFRDITAFGQAAPPGSTQALVIAGMVLATPVLWRRLRLYRIVGGWTTREALQAGATGAIALLVLIFTAIVVFKAHGVSRIYLASLGMLTGAWLASSRFTAGEMLRQRRNNGKGTLRVLLVGGGIGAERFLTALRKHPELGMEAIGYIGRDVPGVDPKHRLGNIADLPAVLAHEVIDDVVICLPFEQWATIRDCAQIAEEQGKTVRVPLWMVDELKSRSRVDKVGGIPLLSMVSTPDNVLQNVFKRGVDIVGAMVGLTLFAPLIAAAAIAIKLTDRGPVLFRQDRVGWHGRLFPVLKLRTMVVDAEARLEEVAHLNERTEITFKATDDPRITNVGRFLRRSSLDEVPQFWNVLVGQMSIVGPRPPLPSEVELYDPRHRRRLSVKPGVTGLWQVSQRTDPSFESWVDLDLEYIDTWSPLTDMRIILRTIPVMLKGTGT